MVQSVVPNNAICSPGPAGIGAPRTGIVPADMLTGAMHTGEEGP